MGFFVGMSYMPMGTLYPVHINNYLMLAFGGR